MKKVLCLAGLAVALLSSLVLRAEPLGAPKASLAPGQFSMAVEYSYTDMDLQADDGDYVIPIEIDGMHTLYLTGSVGVTEWLDVFLRVGGVSLDGETSMWVEGSEEQWDYDYDDDFIYGGGLRLTLGTIGPVTFGAVASYSYASLDGDFCASRSYSYVHQEPERQIPEAETAWGSLKARLHQVTVGIGATWQIADSVALYGGGLLHHVRLKQRATFEGYSGGEGRGEGSFDPVFKNDDGSTMVGGFAGIAWGITEGLSLSVEGNLTEDTCGGSAMLAMAF